MPSEDIAARALRALQAPRERWTSAVAAAVEEVRAYVEAHRPMLDGRPAERARVELGAFASGRIDAARFGALFAGGAPLDPASLARVEHALAELERVAAAGEAALRVDVEPRGHLRMSVAHALMAAGRAFAAAQVVELTRSGRWRADEHGALLEAFGFSRWNRAERQIAPPLVVEVDGADLHAGVLADFLDGTMKIVLLVRGPMPPAALVRLLTPDVLVMQTADAADLDRMGRFSGPAVAALVPERAARFVHDPAAGGRMHERLSVSFLPGDDALAPINGTSVFQQQQELALLRELSAAPAPAPSASTETAPSAEGRQDADDSPKSADPGLGTGDAAPGTAVPSDADTLASWLLRQADLG